MFFVAMMIVSLLIPISSFALDCTATVKAVRVNDYGTLEVKTSRTGTAYPNLCKVTEKSSNIDPETCRAWQNLLLAAHLSGRRVKFYHVDTGSCASGNYFPSSVAIF